MRNSVPSPPAAIVSCHLEQPLDDETWERFVELQRRRPGGLDVIALMRPADAAFGEDEEVWLERARAASSRAPFGLHTHWTSPTHARPTSGDPSARVRAEAEWLRAHGLEPRLFCGGGWYMDEAVAAALTELGYADCTATAFRPSYLPEGAPRLALDEPAWLRVDGRRLLELPTTHSIGMAVRAAFGALPGHVHVYFHDTDLLDRRRRRALALALRMIARRRTPTELTELSAEAETDLAAAAEDK
jgi:hypothetical protein